MTGAGSRLSTTRTAGTATVALQACAFAPQIGVQFGRDFLDRGDAGVAPVQCEPEFHLGELHHVTRLPLGGARGGRIVRETHP